MTFNFHVKFGLVVNDILVTNDPDKEAHKRREVTQEKLLVVTCS